MMWSGDLVDVEECTEGGNTLYVRLAKSELGVKNRISTAAIITIVVVGTIILGVFLWLLWRYRAKIKECSKSLCKSKIELAAFDASRSCDDDSSTNGITDSGIVGR
ncbi:G-type lectin S-receptor-like serine/threonine-protein kinase B120 [Camellia lanceoleosa]|uniref:G-type lectin S-receptor-like serine/threonine-protein kinase B120 n=1 Tax=Camellia lanceoleosa TaxID=1840588 RepID=A0ACC0GPH1_9ERIC|nr:G-type lectin S-receptor-like serine/threonine-protein kinase B120 [Camellia lanceoleosa]